MTPNLGYFDQRRPCQKSRRDAKITL